MSSSKYTVVSHHNLVYANPLSVAKLETIIMRLALPAGATVLDIGTGKGEFAIRLVEHYGAQVIGIDLSEELLAEARVQAATRIPDGTLTLLQLDATQYVAPPASCDVVSCIGATQVLGDYAATLTQLANLVRAGGLLVVGELYWRQEPTQAYLEAFGIPAATYTSHADNITLGVRQGLTPLAALVATEDEFDAYEWQRIWAIETYARQHPADPDVPALLERIHTWRDIYLQWGRATLGFGLYVFQRQ